MKDANILRIPKSSAAVIDKLEEGASLEPVNEMKYWYFVRLSGGSKGWISKKSVTPQKYPKIRITQTTHAYKLPLISSNEIAMLRKDDILIPAEKRGEWYKIFLRGGDYGWVYSSFADEDYKGMLLIKEKSNIRRGPGSNYRILAVVNKGTELRCCDIQDRWSQVVTPNRDIGWILTDLTRDISYTEVVTIRRTNVRSGPGDNFAQLEIYGDQKSFTPINESNGWYEFKFSATKSGWVQKKDTEKKSKLRTVFTLDLCNIRSGPGLSHEIITKVDPATDLLIIGENGDWYNVKLTSQTRTSGWIKKELVFE